MNPETKISNDFSKNLLNDIHNIAIFKRRIQILSRLLAKELNTGKSVLDVGCGDGSLAKSISSLNPALEFHGIDVALRPEIAISAELYDGYVIPFEDNSFDWITIVDVLHHTDDPSIVLKECARVARNGVVIKDHTRQGFLGGPTLQFMDWIGNKGHDVRLPYNFLSKTQWCDLFNRLDLAIISWNENLNIYRPPFNYLFDRQLHMITTVKDHD